MQRILVALLDGLAGARVAAQLATQCGATVRLLSIDPDHMVDESLLAALGRGAAVQPKVGEHGLLDHVTGVLISAGVPETHIERVVRRGEPFRVILDEARAWQAELIVTTMGRHVGLAGSYPGSTTEHLLEFAECPVLVVPTRTERR